VKIVKLQRWVRNIMRREDMKIKSKERIVGVYRGFKVRKILKSLEVVQLKNEIRDLNKLQKLSFNSKTGYATKVQNEKKFNLIKII